MVLQSELVVEAVDQLLAIAPELVEMVEETDQHPIMEVPLVIILVVEAEAVQAGLAQKMVEVVDLEL